MLWQAIAEHEGLKVRLNIEILDFDMGPQLEVRATERNIRANDVVALRYLLVLAAQTVNGEDTHRTWLHW